MNKFIVRPITESDFPDWLRMRLLLWPHHSEEEMTSEMMEMFASTNETPVFIAVDDEKKGCGFLEGGMRKYADGCSTSPVGYIEGWYVEPNYRKQGVGGELVIAFEVWCKQRGLLEVASDTWQDNLISITAHTKLGYTEVERLVHFSKKILS